jgi:putative flippase GtrA
MKQFIAFLLTGGIAAGLNWSSRFMFSIWFNFPVSIVLGYSVGLTSAFVLMRRFVFRGASRSTRLQVPMFVLVNLLGLLQTLVVSLALAKWVFPRFSSSLNPEGSAHLIGVLVPVFTSYVGHKYFTFKR